MRRSPLPLLLFLVLVSLSLVAGCGPRWAILAQSVPSPLTGARNFYIEPIHYDPPLIGGKSEREYLADKSAEQRDSWMTDKTETAEHYSAALMGASPELLFPTQPAPGVFIVRPIVSFIEPGFYGGIVALATNVQMRVQILASDGRMVDEIAVRSLIGASMIYPASGTRLRLAGDDLGRVTAEYIKQRVAGGA